MVQDLQDLPNNSESSSMDLVVFFIVLSLFVAVLFSGINFFPHSHDKTITVKSYMKNFETALKLYKTKKGEYPDSLEKLTAPDKSGNIIMDSIPEDPWGNSYIYFKVDKNFEIICYGADGQEGGEGKNADIKFSELYKKDQ